MGWTSKNSGLPTGTQQCIAANATRVLVGYNDNNGVWQSTDKGATWSKIFDHSYITSIAISPTGSIFVGTGYNGLFVSRNDGQRFINVLNSSGSAFQIKINSGGKIYVCSSTDNLGSAPWLYMSSNNGQSFTRWEYHDAIGGVAVDGSTVYYSRWDSGDPGSYWIYKSTDGGSNFTALNKQTTLGRHLLISKAGTLIIADESDGIYRSADGGTTWTLNAIGACEACACDSEGNIFIATWGGGMYKSADDGVTFNAFNTGLAGVDIADVVCSGLNIWAIDYGYGVYASAPPPKIILSSPGIYGTHFPSGAVEVDPGGAVLFFITPDENYGVTDVLVDDVSVGARDYYLFENVSENHTITSIFGRIDMLNSNASKARGGGSSLFLYDRFSGTLVAPGTLREGSLTAADEPISEPDENGLPVQNGVTIIRKAEMLETNYSKLALEDGLLWHDVNLWTVNDRFTTIVKRIGVTIGYAGSWMRKKANVAVLTATREADVLTSALWALEGWYDPRNLRLLVAAEMQKNAGTTSIQDASDQEIALTLHGTSAVWASDKKSLLFNGTNYIEGSLAAADKIVGHNDATILMWFKKAAAQDQDTNILTLAGGKIRLFTGDTADGYLTAGIHTDPSTEVKVVVELGVIDDAWHCAVLSMTQGGTMRLHVDDMDPEQISIAGATGSDTVLFGIGGDGVNSGYAGRIGTVAVYVGNAFTADEAARWWNSTKELYQ